MKNRQIVSLGNGLNGVGRRKAMSRSQSCNLRQICNLRQACRRDCMPQAGLLCDDAGVNDRFFAPLRILLLIPLLGLVWGLNWPAVRISLTEIPPWTLRALGMTLGGIALIAVAALRGDTLRVPSGQRLRLALAGALSIAAFNVLLAFAQLAGPTSRAAILTFTMPIWASLLARFVLGERFDRRRVTGLVLGIAGLVALGLPLIGSDVTRAGILLPLLASLSWALGTMVSKRWPVSAPAITVAAWQLLFGGFLAGCGMLVFEGLPALGPLSPRVAVAFGFHVLFAQALAYLLWFTIIARVPAGLASLGTLIVPAVGVFGSVALLHERPGLGDWIGLALVIAAAASVMWPGRAKLDAPAAARTSD